MLEQDKTKLIQDIMESRKRLGHSMKDHKPDAWLSLDLTIAQLKTLMFVHFHDATNFKALAEALGVTPPNVTGIVDRLVEQGMLTREYNQQNRRMQMLKLTQKAEDIVNELHERASGQIMGILMSIDIEDLSALARGLKALADATEKSGECAKEAQKE